MVEVDTTRRKESSMDTHQESPKRRNSLARFAAAAAIAIGLGVGSYGIASAASGSATTSTPTATNSAPAAPPGANGGAPWGHQRSDETLLTGDALARRRSPAARSSASRPMQTALPPTRHT
jgi:hypothetical protein